MPARRAVAAAVGVAPHNSWAILVTITLASEPRVVDRRRIELLDAGLPAQPHEHEARALPAAAAESLVARVRASAERRARDELDRLRAKLADVRVTTLTIRDGPTPAIPERFADV